MSAVSVATSARTSSGMVKRKVDDRIQSLITGVVQSKHRGLVLLVGDRAKDQIVNLHLIVSRANHSAKVNLLWCMKNDPDFGSTGKKQQERRARLEVKGGLATEVTKDAFQTFLAQTAIRFCKYSETHKILGQTFGMAVLQDFEAITPNILARTVETVKGGGLVVIMFRSLRSLKQLHTIAMDVHARYRTENNSDVVPRFNERFLLSLTDCDTALCVDDDLNVLPITRSMKNLSKRRSDDLDDAELLVQGRLRHEVDLVNLKERLKPSAAVGPLVHLCQTMDQAKTVLSLMQVVTEKSLNATCVVTAGRGRGKSAALGMAAAGAIAQGYSNIFCTAPSPENMQTFFEFAVRGLKDLGYIERTEFEAMQSSNEELGKGVIRINVFREHRQTIQFIVATDTEKFAQAEIAIIDEAAALPLTLVKKMMGSYLVFLSSTVSGYEGTGRSLSMKLIDDLRKRSGTGATDSRLLKEMSLQDPIRYGPNDPVERWLHKLLCLDATASPVALRSCPHPNTCELFYVSRDALFSYHPLAEELLQRVQSLLAAAHYKNQPNDLQLLSDAPGHHIFVLCAGTVGAGTDGTVPDVYCVIHACEEGHISPDAMKRNMSHGVRPSGDLIPYTLSQCFLEQGFAKLAGLRVVRIATNPDIQRAGYGSRALELLGQYYRGNIALTPVTAEQQKKRRAGEPRNGPGEQLDDEGSANPLPSRDSATNLLTPLIDRPYDLIDYLGVSYGLTMELYNFWKRSGYEVVYVRQGIHEVTGEHTCVMLCPFGIDVTPLRREFHRRFLTLLSMPFRHLPTDLALSIVSDVEVHNAHQMAKATDLSQAGEHIVRVGGVQQADYSDLTAHLSPTDLKRLRLSSTTFIEGGNILDLLPFVAKLYFGHRLYRLPDGAEGAILSYAQAAVLLAVGLQCRTLEEVAMQQAFASVSVQQLRAFLQKAISRIVAHFTQLESLSRGQALEIVGNDGLPEGDTAEEERCVYDASGNVVGLTVSRKVKRQVETDTTLLRDASASVTGAGSAAHKDLQNVFRRPKKISRKR